ncbi:MAG: MBL fold metallo-hydrolase [Pseudomonadota bacterium]|nr:MBL fold metallo-hydrolase [Pseudomonadota bacterium]
MKPLVKTFFDQGTSTFSYIVHSGKESSCAIIDPVQNFNSNNARTDYLMADEIIAFIKENNLKNQWILETHIHADHLSAASYLKNKVGGKVAASQFINNACDNFIPIFNLDENDSKPKMHFDYLFSPDEEFFIGEFNAKALYVPGHTPADTAYYVEDIIFVGDTLFAPDVGTARCDFPGGSARKLFNSINRILSLPKETTMFLCHDYPDDRRNFQNKFTIQEQIEKNIHVKNGTREEDFILLRETRDKDLLLPDLLVPSIQANIRAGQLPAEESNGISYIKVPLNIL